VVHTWEEALVINPRSPHYGETFDIDHSAFGGRQPDPTSPYGVLVLLAPRGPLLFSLGEVALIDERGHLLVPLLGDPGPPELDPGVQRLIRSQKRPKVRAKKSKSEADFRPRRPRKFDEL
jgi:hypothetical protein